MITYEDIRNNEEINTYIQKADQSLAALGYTEHSFAHVGMVAENCGYILEHSGL
jgi:metal-dependent HD superfamily phosphatase/phosphodiesterase